jgi:hypothetical protein
VWLISRYNNLLLMIAKAHHAKATSAPWRCFRQYASVVFGWQTFTCSRGATFVWCGGRLWIFFDNAVTDYLAPGPRIDINFHVGANLFVNTDERCQPVDDHFAAGTNHGARGTEPCYINC